MVNAVIDSGAVVSIIRRDLALKLNKTLSPYLASPVKGVGGQLIIPDRVILASVTVLRLTKNVGLLV